MDDERRAEAPDGPVVGDESRGGDIAGAGERAPAEERPEHVRPTSEHQQNTRFVGAPESAEPPDDEDEQ